MRRSTVVIALAAVLVAASVRGEIYITQPGDTVWDIHVMLGATPGHLMVMWDMDAGQGNTELKPGQKLPYITNADIEAAKEHLLQLLKEISPANKTGKQLWSNIEDLEKDHICYSRSSEICQHIHWDLVLTYADEWRAGLPVLPVSAPITALARTPSEGKREHLIQYLAAFAPEYPIISPPK